MKIHQHQAKELFRKYRIPVPEGQVAFTAEDAVEIARTLKNGGGRFVVKAQIMRAAEERAAALSSQTPRTVCGMPHDTSSACNW